MQWILGTYVKKLQRATCVARMLTHNGLRQEVKMSAGPGWSALGSRTRDQYYKTIFAIIELP